MPKFLIDEDMPRSTAKILNAKGYEALDVREGSHSGIVIAHFPNEVSTSELNNHIINAVNSLSKSDFKGNLIIIEPGKIRIRRK